MWWRVGLHGAFHAGREGGGGFKGTSRTLNDGLEKFMVSFNRGLIVYVNRSSSYKLEMMKRKVKH